MPDRLHAFVWRNWELVEPARMALTVGCPVETIRGIGAEMGLAEPPPPGELHPERSYITVIRRNWHLLPYEQLLRLLDWDTQRLAETLREDDFLSHKLGGFKPSVPPLTADVDPASREACRRVRAIVEREFGTGAPGADQPVEPRFHFLERFSKDVGAPPPTGQSSLGMRLVYSYAAVYGDPLSNPSLDPYPDGLLRELAMRGVNAVWLHSTLRSMAPSKQFPEFGEGCEKRLATLRNLVERARRHGVRIYLYVNEPRAMPSEFFARREGMRGVSGGGFTAMCTSTAEVREWLRDALHHVFSEVPHLGGVFTITASENLTSCASHGQWKNCPRCSKRSAAEIIAEVNTVIADGVHAGNAAADVVVWDWGWHDAWVADAIAGLPKSVALMSVSEWDLPLNRGGVPVNVGEYSLSAVGPGPRATRHWAIARQHGLRTVANIKVNSTWEMSAVPWLPVGDLVARHVHRLSSSGVSGYMLSWTLGGYPSRNLELAQAVMQSPGEPLEGVIDRAARAMYGPAAADVRRAWTAFSEGFENYPYNGALLYNGPQHWGPANPLFLEPTGYKSSMVGFPYDDLDGWRGPYPPEKLAEQFDKIVAGWERGLEHLRKAMASAEPRQREMLAEDLRIAEAAQLHFRSVVNQTRFLIARNRLLAAGTSPSDTTMSIADMRARAEDEIRLARRLFDLTRQDSRIGFEASNHYYYVPLDLVEKVVNCRDVIDRLESRTMRPARP